MTKEYFFSEKSLEKLLTCDRRLVVLSFEVLRKSDIDFKITWGYRDKKTQDDLYDSGRSKLKYPHSNHNKYPSLAVDFVPLPVNWNKIDKFVYIGNLYKEIAKKFKIDIVYGGDWKSFKDNCHIELYKGGW